MYLSYNWLQELVKIPKDISPEQLGERLTLHTVEIEGMERQTDRFAHVLVGEIKEVSPHPDADKLQLAKVSIGKEVLNIVCGAPNIEKGQLVPVALPGAILENGLEIKETEVRGENSQGMLCAADELGLGEDHSGIMVLNKKAKVGQNLAEYFNFDDILFEVDNKSLTNRPDLMGHLGIAREVAAFLDCKKRSAFNEIVTTKTRKVNKEELDIKNEAPDLCPRYVGLKIDKVKVEESPAWLQKRLTAVGLRPINNIVDITNYVMVETGQPMHAFDSNLVSSIRVRRAKQDEKITTLDGAERELSREDLVIADKNKPLAVAGVMGGQDTQINENTVSIMLEAANFSPVNIRKTSQRLDLRTDSSSRFEKSLDPYLTELAIARCFDLVKQVCPEAEMGSALTDTATEKERQSGFNLNLGPIDLDLNWVSRRIGGDIEQGEIIDILSRLGFKAEQDPNEGDNLKVFIPTWRATKDISIKEDIVEEIVRIYGYNKLEFKMPRVEMVAPSVNKERKLERQIKELLAHGCAMTEAYNYSFTNEEKLERLKIDHSGYIKLLNPLSNQHTLLRQNLFTNLFDNVKQNQANYNHIQMFELGSVYLNFSGEINKDNNNEEKLPYQEKRIGMVEASYSKDVFSALKGKVEYLFKELDIDIKFEPSDLPHLWANPAFFAKITVAGEQIGFISKAETKVLKSLGIKKQVASAEINFREILARTSGKVKSFKPLSRYPSVHRDLGFVVDVKVLYNDIKKEIEDFSDLIKEVELFDVYQGDKLGKREKSLAFHIIYRSEERTLQAKEVDELQDKLFERLKEKFEAKIRDF